VKSGVEIDGVVGGAGDSRLLARNFTPNPKRYQLGEMSMGMPRYPFGKFSSDATVATQLEPIGLLALGQAELQLRQQNKTLVRHVLLFF
jgi:hypothetical protein